MTPDDERHGTPAGYGAHYRSKVPYCDECRIAWRIYSASKKSAVKPPRRTRTNRSFVSGNFTEAGYDPADGLKGGRWMWDDRRAIRVWVETGEAA